ncbi:UNVERIFIED_CONTAM: hypothetical protein FKN15_074194 [Acipenser sinensis]
MPHQSTLIEMPQKTIGCSADGKHFKHALMTTFHPLSIQNSDICLDIVLLTL